MTDEQERMLVKRFAEVLGDSPHRPHCERSTSNSIRCTCDMGDEALKIYNLFLAFLTKVKSNQA